MTSFRFCLTIETSKHKNNFKRVIVTLFMRKVTSEKSSKLKIGIRLLHCCIYATTPKQVHMPVFLQFDYWSFRLDQLNYVFQKISFFLGISYVVGIKCSDNSNMKPRFFECGNTSTTPPPPHTHTQKKNQKEQRLCGPHVIGI